jgi:tetratricopeptide (TPR) repeat protein
VPYYRQLLQLAPGDSAAVHGLARALKADQQSQAVVDLLGPWLRRHPEDLAAYLHLGDAHAGLGAPDKAVATWRRALRRQPPSPSLYKQLSDRCQAAGLHAEAIRFLLDGRKATDLPDLFGWELAGLYLRQKDYQKAVDAYLATLQQTPKRYSLVEKKLMDQMADERAAAAIMQALQAALTRISDEAGDPLQAAMLASSCSLERGRPQTGLQILAAVAGSPEIADLLFQYASRCEARGHDAVAARAYALFTERRPDSPYLYVALLRQAEITARRGDHTRAAELYGQLIRRYPSKPETREAVFHLGRLQLEELDDLQGARSTFAALLQTPHRDPWTYGALELHAECSLRAGELDSAENSLQQLQRLDPRSAYPARFRLGELRYFQTDLDAARRIFQELLEQDPAHELANDALELLVLCAALQDQEEVLEHFATAQLRERQRRPSQATAHWNWLAAHAPPALREQALLRQARTRAEEEELEKALALYTELATRNPRGPHAVEAQAAIASIRERRGDLKIALKHYETALLTDPDDARAPEIRLHIQRLRRQVEDPSG